MTAIEEAEGLAQDLLAYYPGMSIPFVLEALNRLLGALALKQAAQGMTLEDAKLLWQRFFALDWGQQRLVLTIVSEAAGDTDGGV